jgi:hypothetical protein
VGDPEIVISSICAHLLVSADEPRYANVALPDAKNGVMRIRGEVGECHDNVCKLLQEKKIDRWIIGFALSDDARWRHHSWGLQKDGTLVETTEARLVYYGVDINRLFVTYQGNVVSC